MVDSQGIYHQSDDRFLDNYLTGLEVTEYHAKREVAVEGSSPADDWFDEFVKNEIDAIETIGDQITAGDIYLTTLGDRMDNVENDIPEDFKIN